MPTLAVLLALICLEMVLGIDNVVVVAAVAAGLPEARRGATARLGLGLGLALRLAVLLVWRTVLRAEHGPAGGAHGVEARELALAAAGAYLIVHALIDLGKSFRPRSPAAAPRPPPSPVRAVVRIAALDLLFSLDSLTAAVGVTRRFGLIAAATVATFLIALAGAAGLSALLARYRWVRRAALVVLIFLGASLLREGLAPLIS